MFSAVLMMTSGLRKNSRQAGAFFLFLCLTILPFITSVANAATKMRSSRIIPAESGAASVNPDMLLIEVYQNLSENKLQLAQTKIDELTEAFPNFQLAQLIKGDLLLMHTRPVTSFGAGLSAAQGEKLKELRDEAVARIHAFREKPAPGLIPRPVLQLRDDQKQVILVDAKKSRLYLYENDAGQLKLLSDHYVSHGKFGINKFKEGDQKTPIGVYYITSHLSGSKLPDFYGPGALPLNYPNDWDKVNGRGGSGIWLHGVPSTSFSRPPLASDGCVVLTNPDFLKIAASVDIGITPVIIAEQIEFIHAAKANAEKQLANKLLEDWRLDLESQNMNRILANYSRNFKTMQGDTLNSWFIKQKTGSDGGTPVIRLRDITHFRYPGNDEMIVSTFTQETLSGKIKSSNRKRQYWIKEASKWRIIFEINV